MFVLIFFFFNDTATTEIYTLSLHDALPILRLRWPQRQAAMQWPCSCVVSFSFGVGGFRSCAASRRSEEHTSELQSQSNLVCRLLLEKKKPATNAAPT